ncbi:phosphotransferase [Nonomuraea spiralis]|uniref:Phosphotransferase n=1 Tax=Nonomuraea spiralis TaxID=46182 RepID=A0ABV5IGV7_9ACTN|nr:phosphotransferase [Nonomuraea spiralis]
MTHAEIEINARLVRDLLRDQHPDLADHPVRLGARGWDNQLWRLGDDLAVRMPWATRDADALLRKEHTWLPALAPGLPLPVPVPQRLGEPSARYPRPWIVTTWVPGEPADRAPSRAARRPTYAAVRAASPPGARPPTPRCAASPKRPAADRSRPGWSRRSGEPILLVDICSGRQVEYVALSLHR